MQYKFFTMQKKMFFFHLLEISNIVYLLFLGRGKPFKKQI